MYMEGFPLAGDTHYTVEVIDVIGCMDADFLASSQADVVTRLGFHAIENIFFTAMQINDQCAVGLDVLWTGEKGWGLKTGG